MVRIFHQIKGKKPCQTQQTLRSSLGSPWSDPTSMVHRNTKMLPQHPDWLNYTFSVLYSLYTLSCMFKINRFRIYKYEISKQRCIENACKQFSGISILFGLMSDKKLHYIPFVQFIQVHSIYFGFLWTSWIGPKF